MIISTEQLAKRAAELTSYKNAMILNTLAAAQAEAEHFQEAVKTAQTALELANLAGQQKLAASIQTRLDLYKAGKPFHETLPHK